MADVGGVASERLRSFVERIERLEEEKAALTGDIREVYSEAKGTGFDVKVLRQIVRLRKMDASARAEMEELVDVYKRALEMDGMQTRERRDEICRARPTPLEKSIKAMGTPVEPTAEEKSKGVVAAFEKNGTRMSIATGRNLKEAVSEKLTDAGFKHEGGNQWSAPDKEQNDPAPEGQSAGDGANIGGSAPLQEDEARGAPSSETPSRDEAPAPSDHVDDAKRDHFQANSGNPSQTSDDLIDHPDSWPKGLDRRHEAAG